MVGAGAAPARIWVQCRENNLRTFVFRVIPDLIWDPEFMEMGHFLEKMSLNDKVLSTILFLI